MRQCGLTSDVLLPSLDSICLLFSVVAPHFLSARDHKGRHNHYGQLEVADRWRRSGATTAANLFAKILDRREAASAPGPPGGPSWLLRALLFFIC